MNTGGKPLMNLLQRYQDLGRGGRREWRENPMESLLKTEGEDHVPRGCLAVYVGPHMRRFVIPTAYLGAPAIKVWMDRAAEEYGYDQRDGLRIPCEEEDFEDILRVLGHSITTKKKHNPIVNKLIKFK